MWKKAIGLRTLVYYIVQLNDVSSCRYVINKSVIHLVYTCYVVLRVRLNSRILIITVD